MISVKNLRLVYIAFLLPLAACSVSQQQYNLSKPMSEFDRLKKLEIPAPVAAKKPFESQVHGRLILDDYAWLKDDSYPEVDDPEVLDYLTRENTYYGAFIAPHKGLIDTVFQEFKGRVDEQETSVPYTKNGYEYRWYYRPAEEYRTRSRRNLATGEEDVFLDESALAKGHEYFVLGDWEISPDNKYLAYSFDTSGDERYQVRIKDLQSGQYLSDVLEDVQGQIEFGADSQTLLYALLEPGKWHAKHINVHALGEPQQANKSIYYEADDGFFIGFSKTSSGDYFLLVSSQGEVQESYVVPTDNLFAKPTKLVDREAGFTQSVDHAQGYFYILANDTHKNFRLARVADANPAYQHWQTLEEGHDNVYLMGLQTFESFIAIKSRDSGVEKIRLRDYHGAEHQVEFPEAVFTASIGVNPEFTQSTLRLDYESMITPKTVFDYDLVSKTLTTRKVQKVPSGYDKNLYETERVMAPARDGTLVPVSLVYRKGFKRDGSQPMHLYAYGAYGATIEPAFSTLRLSALDRGFVYAIAHVRGGAMMGYQWYLDGKLEKRTNTFNDFVDVANFLVKQKYTSAGNISISGRSAGGELMGAVTIQAPDLWRSVNLGVPFVDVLNTMLDASLPLTPPEWQEWGNPLESSEAFDLIKSYSPYDNITPRAYPPMFVSGGLNDPRVTYWEPAKWTAKMRSNKTDNNLLVMRINMGAGHFANSGRYGRLKDYAEEYAFMFLAHDITE